jgi:hypothetical protein
MNVLNHPAFAVAGLPTFESRNLALLFTLSSVVDASD